jgi:hypothetical protein
MSPVEPLTQEEIDKALLLAYAQKCIRASMIANNQAFHAFNPDHGKPGRGEFDNHCDEAYWSYLQDEALDRYQGRSYTEALADAVRDLTDGELLALCGIDPHTFGSE